MLDLGSIITGVIITGILGAITAVSFTFVIPWFNDKTAQDDLNLTKIAEESHYSDKGVYGNMAALKTGRYLNKTLSTTACVVLTPASPAPASDYTVYVTSKSGKKFSYNPADVKPSVVTTIPTGCS